MKQAQASQATNFLLTFLSLQCQTQCHHEEMVAAGVHSLYPVPAALSEWQPPGYWCSPGKQQQNNNITELESTGYSALPSPPRLMQRAVDTWYKQLERHTQSHTQTHTHTHSKTAWCWAPQYLRSLNGGKGKNQLVFIDYTQPITPSNNLSLELSSN